MLLLRFANKNHASYKADVTTFLLNFSYLQIISQIITSKKSKNMNPVTLKYQISVPQVIRVPQQKSTLKTGQISWNNRSEDREIANYHSPIHCNSFTCQFKWVKVIFGEKNLRTTGNFGLELIKVPVRLFDTLEYPVFAPTARSHFGTRVYYFHDAKPWVCVLIENTYVYHSPW